MAEAGPPCRQTDWAQLMRLGLGALRLSPEAFWEMTPVEFARALEGAGLARPAGASLTRSGLERLMAAYPDLPTGRQPPKEG